MDSTRQATTASALDTLGRAGMDFEQSRQVIAGIAGNEATMLAVNHTFFVTAIVLFVAAALVWISPRPKTSGEMPPMH